LKSEKQGLAFVVGAPKAGTFSIYSYFDAHGQVAVSKMKEPNFFVDAVWNAQGMHRVECEKRYLKQFTITSSTRVLLEASPSYLRCQSTPDSIQSFAKRFGSSGVSIIIVIRKPLDRAFSNWVMDVRQGHQKKDFLTSFYESYNYKGKMRIQYDYYQSGLYSSDIERYFSVFGEDAVKVIDFHDLKSNFLEVAASLSNFIGVELIEGKVIQSNVASVPREGIVSLAYNCQILRRIQNALLPDKYKEYLRGIFFVSKRENILDHLTSNEIVKINELYASDVRRCRDLTGLELCGW